MFAQYSHPFPSKGEFLSVVLSLWNLHNFPFNLKDLSLIERWWTAKIIDLRSQVKGFSYFIYRLFIVWVYLSKMSLEIMQIYAKDTWEFLKTMIISTICIIFNENINKNSILFDFWSFLFFHLKSNFNFVCFVFGHGNFILFVQIMVDHIFRIYDRL